MKFLLVALISVPLFSLAQQTPSAGFVVTGSVTGLPEKTKVSLTDVNSPTDTLARGSVSNGKFILKGMVKEPNLVQVNFDGAQKKSILFMGNEKVSLTGDAANIQALTVKGSPV